MIGSFRAYISANRFAKRSRNKVKRRHWQESTYVYLVCTRLLSRILRWMGHLLGLGTREIFLRRSITMHYTEHMCTQVRLYS